VNGGWHWRFERLSFAYFSLPLQRKVGAAPHRGNAGTPTRKQGNAKIAKTSDKKTTAYITGIGNGQTNF
jgi:hypothetical protein